MPRKIIAGVPQHFVIAQTLYSLYINDTPKTLELILLCLQMQLVFMGQRNRNSVFHCREFVV
jgi:hypothetical protein